MKTKMLALFAVLVLALSVAGTAYAAWTDSVFINGEVKTGNFGVEISVKEAIISDGSIAASSDGTTLTITVDNAYPGVTGKVTIRVTNTGTVPAKVTGASYTTLPAPYDNDITWVVSGEPVVGTIINPADFKTFTVDFTVTSEAVENGDYTFTATYAFGL